MNKLTSIKSYIYFLQGSLTYRNHIYSAFLCHILVLATGMFNIIARIGFEIPYVLIIKAMGIGMFLCSVGLWGYLFFPKLKTFPLNSTLILLLSFVLMAYLPFFVSFSLSILLILSGYISFFYILWSFFRLFKWVAILSFFMFVLVFSSWFVSDLYRTAPTNPVFKEMLAVGIADKDKLFLISVGQMIKTYGIPSTGLDGLPFLRYHFGSAWLLASISLWIPCSVADTYNYIFPIVFVPLLLYTIIQVALLIIEKTYESESDIDITTVSGKVFWLLLIVGFVSFFPYDVKRFIIDIGLYFFLSESYLFAILVLFIFIGLLISTNIECISITKKIYIFCLILLLFLLKVSVGFLVFWAMLYILFRKRKLFKVRTIVIVFLFLPITYFTFRLVTSIVKMKIVPFHFIRNYTDTNVWYYFIPVYFASVFAYLLIRIYEHERTGLSFSLDNLIQGKFLIEEILILFSFLSLIPGLILEMVSANAAWFSDVPRRVGMLFLLSTVPTIVRYIENHRTFFHKILYSIILIPFLIGFIYTISVNTKVMIGSVTYFRYKIVNERISKSYTKVYKILQKDYRYRFLNKLDSLDKLPLKVKKNLIANVPLSDSGYHFKWFNHQDEKWKSCFIAPAMSGIALIDGLPKALDIKVYPYYGMYSYFGRNLENIKNLEDRKKILGMENKRIIFLSTAE